MYVVIHNIYCFPKMIICLMLATTLTMSFPLSSTKTCLFCCFTYPGSHYTSLFLWHPGVWNMLDSLCAGNPWHPTFTRNNMVFQVGMRMLFISLATVNNFTFWCTCHSKQTLHNSITSNVDFILLISSPLLSFIQASIHKICVLGIPTM